LRISPRLNPDGFKAFFSTASGWGTFSIQGGKLVVEMSEGELQIDEVQITIAGEERVKKSGVVARAGEATVIDIL
jgi:hypothetical protein